jgi:membrane protease YdiL (CAAX protease family)
MIVGAVWEELCFRAAFLLLVPRTTAGLALGIAAGSFLFGVQHLRNGLRRAAYSCAYGVMFSVLYVLTGNLVAVIVAHAAGNILSGLQWTPRLERARQPAAPTPSIFIG